MAVYQIFMGNHLFFFAQKKMGKFLAKWENRVAAIFISV
jgi:hypothetical protein